jgi:hypothetical protein
MAPQGFSVLLPDGADMTNGTQELRVALEEGGAPIVAYKVQINGGEVVEITDGIASGTIKLPTLPPGYHTIIVDAIDAAGNSALATLSFTILAFEKPIFIDTPSTVAPDVIPVIKGTSRPLATIRATMTYLGYGNAAVGDTETFEVAADEQGIFTIIPNGRLSPGVYELVAVATDAHGAQSEPSDILRIVVEEPGYIKIGTMAVGLLSIIVPLVGMVALLILLMTYIVSRGRQLRRGVVRESKEAQTILSREFRDLRTLLEAQEQLLISSRKTQKLTKQEQDLIQELSHALGEAEKRVQKEIVDVTDVVE